jgi:hypothetical protein
VPDSSSAVPAQHLDPVRPHAARQSSMCAPRSRRSGEFTHTHTHTHTHTQHNSSMCAPRSRRSGEFTHSCLCCSRGRRPLHHCPKGTTVVASVRSLEAAVLNQLNSTARAQSSRSIALVPEVSDHLHGIASSSLTATSVVLLGVHAGTLHPTCRLQQ